MKLWDIVSFYISAGEEPHSYGYGGTGKFSVNCKFQNYGDQFGQGDIVGALLDMESRPPTISFTKNGQWLGIAASLRNFKAGEKDFALFPHILSKNSRQVEKRQ